VQRIYIVGGNILDDQREKGNIFTVPSNKHAEFNMFLDPLVAKTVVESNLDITLFPLKAQSKETSFPAILKTLELFYKNSWINFCPLTAIAVAETTEKSLAIPSCGK